MRSKKYELGRTMVEMLGVLAVVGVLTVIGTMGYTHAMRYLRANQIIDDFTRLALKTSEDIIRQEFPKSGEYETKTTNGWSAIIGLNGPEGFYIYMDTTNSFRGGFPKEVVQIVGERAIANQWKEPRELYFGYGFDEEQWDERQILDNSSWKSWLENRARRGRSQFYIAAFFTNDLLPRIGTLEYIDYQDRNNPTTCKGFNNNACQTCIERGNYPVKYEYKPILSSCEMTNGEKGQCNADHQCVDLCANITCEAGTKCESGTCVCPDGQEKCGSECCEKGFLCMGLSESCKKIADGCITNADCEAGQFCDIATTKPSSYWTTKLSDLKGTCKNVGKIIPIPVDWDGDGVTDRVFYSFGSSEHSSWFAAKNLCQAVGKKLLSLQTLGAVKNANGKWVWPSNQKPRDNHGTPICAARGWLRLEGQAKKHHTLHVAEEIVDDEKRIWWMHCDDGPAIYDNKCGNCGSYALKWAGRHTICE